MKLSLAILLFTGVLLGIVSCSEQITDTPHENKSPETFLFLYPDNPDSLSQQKSRLKVHWWGDDPDGLIIGYYFKWEGLEDSWTFTTKNDSTFSLPIGTADTTFRFLVAAVDSRGNGKYDHSVSNGVDDFGTEPFIDDNGDNVYNTGEFFYDIGRIDPTPAAQKFPIKNSSPNILWSKTTILPLESFPVITLNWEADDLDGDESIVAINLALNDTTEFVKLDGYTRLVTLRIDDASASEPEMQILINGSENNIFKENLKNLKLDANNRLFIQAEDISGAKSKFIPLPDTTRDWYVLKPKGKVLIIDDLPAGSTATTFYNNAFNTINGGALAGKFNVFDLEKTVLPFPNITFFETLKLFDYVYWYSDQSPNLDFLTLVTQKYISGGGKIAFSLTFQDSSDSFILDLATLQNFLPIDGLGQSKPLNFLFPGARLLKSDQNSTYPALKTALTISFVRTFVPSTLSVTPVYDLSSAQLNGNIAFIDNSKSLFFIGMPLHQCDGDAGTINQLLRKIFFEEFGLSL
ncbi:MAG: hypothetical protein KJ799_11100 [Bacteroidetes bacterium]|nr:hypothetical protein [Bacteroidota bacterium]